MGGSRTLQGAAVQAGERTAFFVGGRRRRRLLAPELSGITGKKRSAHCFSPGAWDVCPARKRRIGHTRLHMELRCMLGCLCWSAVQSGKRRAAQRSTLSCPPPLSSSRSPSLSLSTWSPFSCITLHGWVAHSADLSLDACCVGDDVVNRSPTKALLPPQFLGGL